MRKMIILLFAGILMFNAKANDAAYFVSGNQLIPTQETDISVKKEILTITKSEEERYVDVTVYYEFYNPGKAKKLTVGFEATSGHGGVDPTPEDGHHRYIHDFTVNVNEKTLSYDVALIDGEKYAQFRDYKQTLTDSEMNDMMEFEYPNIMYVYHFDVDFKPGLNIIKHTYTCDLSGSVGVLYNFDYILTAAKRWGNGGIDDFSLLVDMGNDEMFYIENSFGTTADWSVKGNGKVLEDENYTAFYSEEAVFEFRKKDFKPSGELSIQSNREFWVFNFREHAYINPKLIFYFPSCEDPVSKKILRNVPFAKRGYVFRTPELKAYFEKQIWYRPDTSYKPETDKLTLDEQEWVKHYSSE